MYMRSTLRETLPVLEVLGWDRDPSVIQTRYWTSIMMAQVICYGKACKSNQIMHERIYSSLRLLGRLRPDIAIA